jgi:RNA polymerase sigma-70 factor (ECF subfamily)
MDCGRRSQPSRRTPSNLLRRPRAGIIRFSLKIFEATSVRSREAPTPGPAGRRVLAWRRDTGERGPLDPSKASVVDVTGKFSSDSDRGEQTAGRDDRTDESLVEQVLDGNQRAFEALLFRHEPRVLRVLRLLGVPSDDREDVAQEVFVRVFRFLGGFKPGNSFAGWVYRITVNGVHDYRGRVGRRRRDEAEWIPGLEELAADESRPERRDFEIDLKRQLELALDDLSERERAVFVLRELEGLSTREVARSLGITGVTVRRHLGRARKSLQRTLGTGQKKDRSR